VEKSVLQRYARAAGAREAKLCCPVEYDRRYLDIIPREILERDYGCGDPSRHLQPGETVLDLGSGGGKICYIAAQVVGPRGRVIGIDMNDQMLRLAEAHRQEIGDRLGYHNVTFHKGRIQDLAPLIDSASIDVVVSNCVLNLVRHEDRRRLFEGIHRVLRADGRAVISDIVSDRQVPADLQSDPELWSGCISGAFREDRFLDAFGEAGFHGRRVLRRDEQPWRVVGGIEFRSVTVIAFKGEQRGCC
jgi:arsenite methyltransferase